MKPVSKRSTNLSAPTITKLPPGTSVLAWLDFTAGELEIDNPEGPFQYKPFYDLWVDVFSSGSNCGLMKDREVTWETTMLASPASLLGCAMASAQGASGGTCWPSATCVWLNMLWYLSPFSLHEVASVSTSVWSQTDSDWCCCFDGHSFSPQMFCAPLGLSFSQQALLENTLITHISLSLHFSQVFPVTLTFSSAAKYTDEILFVAH